MWLWLKAWKYRYLWTSERDQWCLLEVVDHNGEFVGHLISQNGKGRLRIEDDAVSAYVKQQMKQAGARIISHDESMKATLKAMEQEVTRRQQLQAKSSK